MERFKKWEALQKSKERMKRNYELLEPFLVDDEDTRQEFRHGMAQPVDPLVWIRQLEESLIGKAGLNIGPFSGQYTGTDQGGIDFGPLNISGGIA